MREIVLICARRLLKALGACTAIIVLSLLEVGRLYLMGGIIAGFITGVLWYGVMLGRLWRSTSFTAEQAGKQMAIGFILRLFITGAVFWIAIQIDLGQFIAVVTGFCLVYVIGMALLMHTSISMPAKDQ